MPDKELGDHARADRQEREEIGVVFATTAEPEEFDVVAVSSVVKQREELS